MNETVGDRARREEPPESIFEPRRPVRCAVCGAEFTSREHLEEHEREEHGQP